MDRNRKIAVAWLAGLVVLGLLAAGWAVSSKPHVEKEARPSPGPSHALVPTNDQPAADPPSAAAVEAITPPRTKPAALPRGLPAAELVAVLEPRARAGDAVAACRLALELAECREVRHWRTHSEAEIEQELARVDQNDPRQLEMTERRLAWYARRDQRKRECEALPEYIREAGPQFLLQSALQGNRAAMVGFANLQGIGGADLVANPTLYAQYRQHAFPLWRKALEAGSVGAVQLWLSALSSNGFQFFGGVLPDEYRDLALAQSVMQEVQSALGVDPDSSPLFPRITGDIDEDAAARARALFDRHFRDSPGLASAKRQLERLQATMASAEQAPGMFGEDFNQRAEHLDERCSISW